MSSSNTPNNPTTNEEKIAANMAKFYDLACNAMSSRIEWMKRLMDPRRDIDDECGYPRGSAIDPQLYQDLYDREPVSKRVVEMFPLECWQTTPTVYEDEDAETVTPFEEAWDKLGTSLRGEGSRYKDEKGNPIWEYLKRVDILSGIGEFGILYLGIDDGMDPREPAKFRKRKGTDEKNPKKGSAPTGGSKQPKDPSKKLPYESNGFAFNEFPEDQDVPTDTEVEEEKPVRLLYLRAFPQSMVQITKWETELNSPRFGMPTEYLITFNDPRVSSPGIGYQLATKSVHWTRVIHIADNLSSSEIYGIPRMRPVLNRLLDLRKLYSGSAEMYWRGAFPGYSLETTPQLGGDVEIDKEGLRNMMEEYTNGLQRYLALMGMTAKSLAPQVVDPTSQIQVQLDAICIEKGYPKRIFMGTERGELASSQDEGTWNDRKRERQTNYLNPRVVVPFVDRAIDLGCLPEPDDGYHIDWPDLDSQTEAEKAQIAATKVTALAGYVSGQVESLIPPQDFLTRIMDFSSSIASS